MMYNMQSLKRERVGTDPTERAFYRAFRDLNPQNDLGSGLRSGFFRAGGETVAASVQIRRDRNYIG